MATIEMLRPETPAEKFDGIIEEIELLEAQFSLQEIGDIEEDMTRQKPSGRSDQGFRED